MSNDIDGESTVNAIYTTFVGGSPAIAVEVEIHGIKSKITMQGELVDE